MSDYNFADSVLPESIINTLKDNDIKAIIEPDLDGGFNPREFDVTSSVWVGIDVSTEVHEVDLGDCFEDYVSNYCREILKCSVDDIIWATVYKYDHSGVSFSLNPFSCPWDSGIDGFIYETKQNVRDKFGFKRISKKLESKIKDRFKSEVELYSKWANGEIYTVTLEDINDEIGFDAIGCLIGLDDKEEQMFCDAINEILACSPIDLQVQLPSKQPEEV